MSTESPPKTVTVPCRGCRASVVTESLPVLGKEWAFLTPHHCPRCEAAQKAAREREIQQEATARREEEIRRVIPPAFRPENHNPKHEDWNEGLWQSIINWTPAAERGIGLVGPSGRCKSRVLGLLAARLILSGARVEWCRATDLQWASRAQFWDDKTDSARARQWLASWKKAPILILDDIGKNGWSPVVETEFFDLLDYRALHRLPTLWTANTDPEELLKLGVFTPDRGAPIVGRLFENSEIQPVT